MTELEQLYQEWRALQPMKEEYQQRLNQKFMLDFNYNSNHLEGNTLTYGQTELLFRFDQTDGNAPMRDYEEMKAHQVALMMVQMVANEKEQRPLTEAFIRELHQTMLREDYEKHEMRNNSPISYTIHAGVYKTRPNSVITVTGERFDYASPEETPALMTDLVSWYNEEEQKGEMSPIQLATLFHYRYIRIHPFEDGNGRISRLLVNYILARHGYPMIVILTEDKANYLKALHKCDVQVGSLPSVGAQAGLEQITPFVEYMEGCLKRALTMGIKAAKGESIEEDDDFEKRVALLAREAEMKRGDVKRKTNSEVLYILENFVEVLSSELRQTLNTFSPFYNKIQVGLNQKLGTSVYRSFNIQSYKQEMTRWREIDGLDIEINLSSATNLLSAKESEFMRVFINFDIEQYTFSYNNKWHQYKYGTLPSESERKELVTAIKQDIYNSIEKKVNKTEMK
ncbi:MAG: Fic family protein [Paludibacteraceae bacterium]|nr:Fic family protein [Paludibacteraceae bacterium]